jgi:hypothetical protein
MKKIISIAGILVVLIALVACAPAADQPAIEDGGGLPPVAAVKAREFLAAKLGVGIEKVGFVTQEQVEWSDSCLGLGGPAESCLAVIVPGWQVELEVEGETYIARTDELGDVVRIEGMEPPVAESLPPVAAIKAQEFLAAELGVEIENVEIISQEQTEWPDGCLGLGGPDEMCTLALVPGWRVELKVEGETYIARTDEMGDAIRLES